MSDTSKMGSEAILEKARRDSHEFKERLIASGELLTGTVFSELLHITEEEIQKGVRTGRIIEIEHLGQVYYPAFYAEAKVNRFELETIAAEMKDLSASQKLQFFMRPKYSLGGITPVEAIANNRFESVRKAAEAFFQR